MTKGGFKRTTCGCSLDVENCRRQPGVLAPGDAEAITAYLLAEGRGAEVDTAFVASPGAIVANTRTGERFQIPTITPARSRVGGPCRFLSSEGSCTIHPVAPFGCAYFDAHMTKAEGQRRSVWMHREIVASPSYHALRANLPEVERDGSPKR